MRSADGLRERDSSSPEDVQAGITEGNRRSRSDTCIRLRDRLFYFTHRQITQTAHAQKRCEVRRHLTAQCDEFVVKLRSELTRSEILQSGDFVQDVPEQILEADRGDH